MFLHLKPQTQRKGLSTLRSFEFVPEAWNLLFVDQFERMLFRYTLCLVPTGHFELKLL